MGVMQSLMGWAEKFLLKGTVSPNFKHCGIAVDSPGEKAANKSTPQESLGFLRQSSELPLRQRAKHKQHQIRYLSCTKGKHRLSFHVAGWGFQARTGLSPSWSENRSCWCKGQQCAELVSALVRRVFPNRRHLIGRWWVTDAEVHRQTHLIGWHPISALPATRSVMDDTEGAKAIVWIN